MVYVALGSVFFIHKVAKYQIENINKMTKPMLLDGTTKNIDSNDYKRRFPRLKNRSLLSISSPTFLLLTLYLIFFIGCFTSSQAQPYKGNLNDISWARYVAPSPLAMSANSFNEYEDQDSDVDHAEGIMEDAPEKDAKKNNVRSPYDELDHILEDENELQSPKSGAMTHEKDSEPSAHPELTRESVPQTSGIFHEDVPMMGKPLRSPNTNFKLRVRKNSPNFQLRLRRNPNFQLRVRKASPNFQLRVRKASPNFQLRVRKSPNFQLRVRKSPNFQLRVRKSPNFQLRVRKNPNFQLRVRKSPNFQLRVRKNPNFQLRLKKRAAGSAFQLRVRKDIGPTTTRQRRNFQLRVRKDDPDYERMLQEDQMFVDGMTRNVRSPSAFQLRVRKAPSSFQLRVRKDGSAMPNYEDEEQYLDELSEADLNNYANTLPAMDLPAFITAARKRSARNFQLRV